MKVLGAVILFLCLTLTGSSREIDSGTPGLILWSQGICAAQVYVLEGPSLDPQADSLVPSTTLRSGSAVSGKQLQTFLLPWTPSGTGSLIEYTRALATGADGGLHASYSNGVQFRLDSDSVLELQNQIYPGSFRLRLGRLWMRCERSVELRTPESTLSVAEGTEFAFARDETGEKLWVLGGEVEWTGKPETVTPTDPWWENQPAGESQLLCEGRFEEAVATLDFEEMPRLLASLESLLGRAERAETLYRETLRKDPQDGVSQLRLGELLARQGKMDEALATWSQVRGRARILALALQASVLGQADRKKEAREILDEALELSKEAPPLAQKLLRVVEAINAPSPRESLQILSELREQHPFDPFLANDVGVYTAANGDVRKGLALLREAREAAPLNPIVRLNTGTMYLLAGQFLRAQNELAVLAAYAPDSGVVRQALAFTLGKQGYSASESRLLVQSTALDPLLVGPVAGQVLVNATYRENETPEFLVNTTRRIGQTAISLSGEATAQNNVESLRGTLEVGSLVTKKDHLVATATLGNGTDSNGTSKRASSGSFGLAYERRLGDKTRLWANLSREAPVIEGVRSPGDILEDESTRVELRLDRELSATNSLSLGAVRFDGKTRLETLGTVAESGRTVERLWVQDSHIVGSKALLTGGLGMDRIHGGNSVITPYLGVVLVPDQDTTFSLAAVRHSDIVDALDLEPIGRFGNLSQLLISSTTLYPLRDRERFFLEQNSGDGLPLPYWDYRLQVRKSVLPELYLVGEVFQTDVLPSDLGSSSGQDPRYFDRSSTQRSRMRGASLEGDFWSGSGLLGKFQYFYRDYRTEDGTRWVLVPRHELTGLAQIPVFSKLNLGLLPVYQAGIPGPNGEMSVGSLSVLVQAPIPHGLLSAGYANLISSNRGLAEGGLRMNLFLNF